MASTDMLHGANDTDRLGIVREAVARINGIRHDDEVAHGHEDVLYVAVLQAIAGGAPDAAALAAEALRTQEIDFARWCA